MDLWLLLIEWMRSLEWQVDRVCPSHPLSKFDSLTEISEYLELVTHTSNRQLHSCARDTVVVSRQKSVLFPPSLSESSRVFAHLICFLRVCFEQIRQGKCRYSLECSLTFA